MATIVLSAVGFALGGPLGASIGSFIGSQIDQALFAPTIKSEGPRLGDLSVQASSYGNPIPRVFGAENRISGNVIWSTGLVETKSTKTQGGKGGGPKTKTTTYTYHVDCAIALCRGQIGSVKRIWADGKLFRDEAGVQKHATAIRLYTGTESQSPDPTMQAALGAGNCPAHRGLAYIVFEHLELADFGNRLPNFTFEVEATADGTVANVINELCDAANVPFLDAARTEYLDLRGYTLAGAMTVRSALEPLRSAFFFDASEIEGEMQFFPIDAPPVARIPRAELGAHQFGTDRPHDYELQRTADIELPRQVMLQHIDPARDYQANSQRARRSTVASDADLSVVLPIVMDASTGKGIAEKMLSIAWLRRDKFNYQLPISYMHIAAGNKIVVGHDDGKDRSLRVNRAELRLPGSILVECETDGSSVLTKAASAVTSLVPTQVVTLPGVTTAHLLDLPILRDIDDTAGFYVAGNGPSTGWPGAVVYRSRDGGVNYEPFGDLIEGAVIGVTSGALGNASPHYWDETSTVTITLLDTRDTLESVTELQVLNGANACVIGDEVLQFRTATLIGLAQYQLSGLLRGRKGTEDKIAGHAAGDRFILLTAPGVYRPVLEVGEVGIARSYKASSVGTLLSDAPPFSFTHSGRYAKPYAAAHLAGTRNGGGDLAMTWIRRTRLDAPWADGIDAPLGETTEAYEVDILTAGGVLKRTLTSATQTATYTAADQVTDFGGAQSSIRVKVYQISSRAGRGLPKEAVL
jgi:Putative phage tail protein